MFQFLRHRVQTELAWRRAATAEPSALRLAARGMVDAALEIAGVLLIIVALALFIAYMVGGS